MGEFLVIAWICFTMSGLAWMKVWMVSAQALPMSDLEYNSKEILQENPSFNTGAPVFFFFFFPFFITIL
jgi:hypothetical protein